MSVDKFGRYSVTGEKSSVFNKDCSLPLTPDGDYNIGNKRLKFVKDPKDNNDAINLHTLKAETLTNLKLKGKDTFNANNCRIINIADPQNKQDSVTKGYADSLTIKCLKLEGDTYNANGKRILNVDDPLLPSDVVTIQYMDKVIPKLKIDHWDFATKRLSNVQEPVYDGEAVNLATLRSLAISKKRKTDNKYDANNLKISNIGDCEHDGDAVNKRMLDILVKKWTKTNEKHLERLGSALFHYIHRSSGRSADAQVDSRNYLDWAEIHGSSSTLNEKEDDISISKETENEEEEEPLRVKKVLDKNMDKQE